MRLVHEFDGHGWHRIVLVAPQGTRHEGEWASYQGIAWLKCHTGEVWMAVTGYHGSDRTSSLGPRAGVIYQVSNPELPQTTDSLRRV